MKLQVKSHQADEILRLIERQRLHWKTFPLHSIYTERNMTAMKQV